jgi:hypothetical protein
MIALQIARIITSITIFLDRTEDDIVDPDAAVEMLESLGSELIELDKSFLRELIDAFPVVALEYSGEMQDFVRDIPSGYYLEEALAADDPVKLAELERVRDAKG